jgi:glycerate kinase
MSRIVVALDSLKGSITAAQASAALAAGWSTVDPSASILPRPMADGGEGTVAAFAAADEAAKAMAVTVRGSHGEPVETHWLLLPDGTGVVELASTSGIEMLGDRRLPWDADTLGFGQGIAAALDHGVARLVLGIGSSASTDGGVGLLTALGARFLDARGAPVPSGARGLSDIVTADLDGLRALPPGGVVVLTDVTNPLLGAEGAATVFGPQKGFDAEGVERTDAALAHLAALMPGEPALPGAGAAGGAGFALHLWGATLTPGAPQVAALVGLETAVREAELVITGEGSFDGQSAAGKVPSFVADLAGEAGVAVALVAGRIGADADTAGFVASLSLTDLAGSAQSSMADPVRWLRAAGAELARRVTA